MRIVRILTGTLLLLGLAVSPAVADSSPSASSSPEADGPTEAGTSFRTAAEVDQGTKATAQGSTGDYMYWSFPAEAGQRPTARAVVTLPKETASASTWQLDVYDGLRRRQACQYGAQTRTAATGAATVDLSCTLRTVRAWSEPWANDPLPGTYYIRLTATNLATGDRGLAFGAETEVESKDIGGPAAVDGSLAEPLVPGIAVTSAQSQDSDDSTDTAKLFSLEPDGGWGSGWWSDRWVWTGIGGLLAALAGVGGYALTRGSGRPAQVPPGH
ncbi:hypothetical protein SRB5_00280 [Streptomyces sp. RB5]|uniref:Secreted protein n=1 Tax=Streptomyces smaragdinus TaxID=2585196 RepID=A0A7K0C8Y6_9ACTN|nr:hypothetical protein [Streptomyces smaragdinus]MQY09925.1 hypothetical protein [Streptomyces smaragdinus]